MKFLSCFTKLVVIVHLVLLAYSLHSQSVYYVNGSGLPGGNGQSWGTAFNDLQEALDSACLNSPAEIWVAAGTYYPVHIADTSAIDSSDRSHSFLLCNEVAVYGGFAGNENELTARDWVNNVTILSGNIDNDDTLALNSFNVVTFRMTDSTAVMDGFTITGGNADNGEDTTFVQSSGGGIRIGDGAPVIRNCILRENRAYQGGGIYHDSSSALIINCSFIDNHTVSNFSRGGGMSNSNNAHPVLINCVFNGNSAAAYGGGIYNIDDAAITLTSCTFTNNFADSGGGLYSNFSASSFLTECSFIENTAEDEGGGMYNLTNSSSVLINCSFINNESLGYGGGMHTNASSLTLTNCFFADNKAYTGGGIYSVFGSVTEINSSSFSANEAEVDAGGIYINKSLVTLTNCTLSGNVAGEEGGGIKNEDSSLKLINCTISGNEAGQAGGGLFNNSDAGPLIANSIFWNNMVLGDSLSPSASIFNNGNSSADILYCLIANSGGSNNWDESIGTDRGNNIDEDPLFVFDVDLSALPNSTGNLRLQSESPAINAGSLDTTRLMIPAFDLDGNPRIVHGRIDMGAYEFQGALTLPGCDITGPNSVLSLSTVTFIAPDGMTTYTWSVDGNAKIIGDDKAQSVIVETGKVNSYLLILNVLDSNDITSTCALKVQIELDCSIYDSLNMIYVDIDAIGANNGASWTNAFVDLQYALQINCPQITEIWVANGIYNPTTIFHDRVSTFHLKNGISIYGGFAGNEIQLKDRDVDANPTILSGEIDHDGDLAGNVYNTVTGSGTDSTSVLDGFTISGGNADGSVPGYSHYSSGAGIFIRNGSPSIYNCTITNNLASTGAGCMNDNSSPIMTNCTFTTNVTDINGAGGGMFNGNNSSPVLTSCNFINNTSTRRGGGMFNDHSTPVLHDCMFIENKVTLGLTRGGGMFNFESSPVLSHCIFRNNTVSASGLGGGMYNQINSSPIMTHCTFEGNLSKNGCGMYNQNSSPILTDCIFTGNETRFEGIGGGMYNDRSAPLLTRCTFSDNFGYDYGGGIHNQDASPVLDQCTFLRNESFEYGGAGMSNNNSSPTLTACLFDSNFSALYGGGMYNLNGSSVDITQCIFNENTAILGGGIYVEDDTFSLIMNCIFNRNIALGSAGGMQIFNSSPTLINCSFNYNTAGSDAGGIYIVNDSPVKLINIILTGNSAVNNGGAIYNVSNEPVILTNCTISGNTAGLDGGAIFKGGFARTRLRNCILWNNKAHELIDTTSSSIFLDHFSIAEISYSLIANSGGSKSWNEEIGEDHGNNIDSDPLFVEDVDLQVLPDSTGNLRLRLGSPALNAGTPDTTGLMIPPLDYDGNPRIVNGRIDMGAFAYQNIVIVDPIANKTNHLNVYPNPADKLIHIDTESKAGDVMITNMLGQIALLALGIQPDNDNKYSIDIAHLKPGVYVVHLTEENGEQRAKIITVIH